MLPAALPPRMRLCEMGPRDGLQNIPDTVPLAAKLGLIERLQQAGLEYIEVAAFVSPRAVPQMADGEAVCAGLTRRPGVTYLKLAMADAVAFNPDAGILAGAELLDAGRAQERVHGATRALAIAGAAPASAAETARARRPIMTTSSDSMSIRS